MKKILQLLFREVLGTVAARVQRVTSAGFGARRFFRKTWKPKSLNLGHTNRGFAAWGWETVDLAGADYNVDFRTGGIELPDGCCENIYSSHMIEHMDDESAMRVFREAHRVLQPGGVFRIVCPDLDRILQAYRENDVYFFMQAGSLVHSFVLNYVKTGVYPPEALQLHNHVVRSLASYADTGGGPIVEESVFLEHLANGSKYDFAKWCVSCLDPKRLTGSGCFGHVNAYAYDKLEGMLREAGFRSISRCQPHQSASSFVCRQYFRRNENRKAWISLYVEAVK